MSAPQQEQQQERVYLVLGEPSGDVHVWSDRSLAISHYTVLVAANLDAECIPIRRVRWDDSARAALRLVLGPGERILEHETGAPIGPGHPFYVAAEGGG